MTRSPGRAATHTSLPPVHTRRLLGTMAGACVLATLLSACQPVVAPAVPVVDGAGQGQTATPTPTPSATGTVTTPSTTLPVPGATSSTTSDAAPAPATPAAERTTFVASDEDVLNPERGWHTDIDLLADRDLTRVREEGYTLARAYVRADAFRDRPLSAQFLADLDAGFDAARAAGIKVIPRVSYNWESPQLDAPVSVVEGHIAQLAPVWQANADVIAVMQAGFVGAWGEWHSSTNDTDSPANKARVHAALLDALPQDRMIQLRYPSDIERIYDAPLTAAAAFDGSDQARTGFKNDCFLTNEWDAGTWPGGRGDPLRDYMAQVTEYVAVGGETCILSSSDNVYTACGPAMDELARFHWDYLNAEFYEGDLQRWRDEGCYDDVTRKLGYRLVLETADLPTAVSPGEPFRVSVAGRNEGWGKVYNPRPVQLVLASATTSAVVELAADPRRWAPSEAFVIEESVTLPDLPPGEYSVSLRLPDPADTLADRAEYSVQFANQGVWDAATGRNVIGTVVVR